MAKQEDLDKAVARMGDLVREIHGDQASRVDLHLSDSGEMPYRVFARDEQYAYAGLATGTPLSDPDGASASGEAGNGAGGHRNG